MDLDMSIRWIAPFTRTSKLYWTSVTLRSGEKPTTCTLNPPDTRVALRAVIAGEVEFTVVEVSGIFEGPFWILPVKPIVPVTVPVTSRRTDCAGNTASVAFAGTVKPTVRPPVENCTAA